MIRQGGTALVAILVCIGAVGGTLQETRRTIAPTSVFIPPPCVGNAFNDVPQSSPFCRWIKKLAEDGITSGCGNGNFCPGSAVTREQMAVFLETAMRGTATWTPVVFKKTLVASPVGTPAENGLALAAVIGALDAPSATNKYLIYIEPGEYLLDATLELPDGVMLKGAGKSVTTIKTEDLPGPVVTGSQTEISDLQISADGSGSPTALEGNGVLLRNVALFAFGADAGAVAIGFSGYGTLIDVDFNVYSNGIATGITGISATLKNVEMNVTSPSGGATGISVFQLKASDLRLDLSAGGSAAYGVSVTGGVAEIHGFSINARNTGSGSATGLESTVVDAHTLRDGTISVQADGPGIALRSFGGDVDSVKLTYTGGSFNLTGIYQSAGTLKLRNSSVSSGSGVTMQPNTHFVAKDSTIVGDGGIALFGTGASNSVKIATSEIGGTVTSDATPVCIGSYTPAFAPRNTNCTP